MKFKFTNNPEYTIDYMLNAETRDRLIDFTRSIKKGEKMELIIRKEISWDTSRMRRYFEGPVVDFVRDRFADIGVPYGKGDLREALKYKFLGCTEEHGMKVPISTTSLTRPKWIEFLKDIDAYCMDEFGCGLPETDHADIGD